MDISTTIASIKFPSLLMNASGCWCRTLDELNDLKLSRAGAIVSKSSTILKRHGHLEPRLYLDDFGSINSMGLPNESYEFYLEYGSNVVTKPFIQSIYPFSLSELDVMLTAINKTPGLKLVECNLSCPNLKPTKYSIFEHYEQHFDRIYQNQYQNLQIGYKLQPFSQPYEFDHMSSLLLKYDAKFITSVNSIPRGLIIDLENQRPYIYPNDGFGGIGGRYLKPVGLANVYEFSRRLHNKIDIIGCGGISTGQDVAEYVLCGAKAVQIGTHLIRNGPDCFGLLEEELWEWMEMKKYESILEFCQKLMAF